MGKVPAKAANATCGWCNAPVIAPPGYDRRIHTVYCPAIIKIISGVHYRVNACEDADKLFRLAFADDNVMQYRKFLRGEDNA